MRRTSKALPDRTMLSSKYIRSDKIVTICRVRHAGWICEENGSCGGWEIHHDEDRADPQNKAQHMLPLSCPATGFGDMAAHLSENYCVNSIYNIATMRLN